MFINIRTLCECVHISALVGTTTDSAQTKVHLCPKVTSHFYLLYCFRSGGMDMKVIFRRRIAVVMILVYACMSVLDFFGLLYEFNSMLCL